MVAFVAGVPLRSTTCLFADTPSAFKQTTEKK